MLRESIQRAIEIENRMTTLEHYMDLMKNSIAEITELSLTYYDHRGIKSKMHFTMRKDFIDMISSEMMDDFIQELYELQKELKEL